MLLFIHGFAQSGLPQFAYNLLRTMTFKTCGTMQQKAPQRPLSSNRKSPLAYTIVSTDAAPARRDVTP
ncbi:hypothetical protein FPOA_08510 [Fusarium poae]|uniref:Uncharacterized protein n=1 Tax=Fusarium poae TaxID=36050 RepID=A0A1B8AP82_FUSPO|nr:hypothetical protein FPOA_08510 [Fusarium poae]